ncbi:MAG TPA: prolyl oligopeptidase family serine peptidase [Gemmatimonadaceae bacterium]|jgi:prolyl oligopeptidase
MKVFPTARSAHSARQVVASVSALVLIGAPYSGAQTAPADPYRWLENITSPEVRSWVTAQNAVTESYLSKLPRRAEMHGLANMETRQPQVGAPFGGGERLFFYANTGVENQPALYVQDKPVLPPRVLIDPNAFSHDGLMAIVDEAASPAGKYLAYAVSTQGSAWRVVRVRDVRSGQDLADELHGIKRSPLAWTRDERGFFYVRSDLGRPPVATNPLAPDGRQQVFYHRLGRAQKDDDLVFDDARHPEWQLRADVSEDGQYLVISAGVGAKNQNRLYFIDLDNPGHPNLGAPIVKLFDAGDAVYDFVANAGPIFFIRTTKNAPRARLVAVDINSPDEAHWTTIVRETFDPLIDALRVDDRIVAHRLHDAHSVLELYTLDGNQRGDIALPGVGTVTDLHGRGEYRELYFRYSSFIQRPIAFRYDLDAKTVAMFKDFPPDSSLSDFETTQLYYTSADGTRIPMFITARRGITLDSNRPALLSAFGAFGASETPRFSPFVAGWLMLGGVYAVANVRGGGEYGRAWHDAATGAHKQVSIDDFIAAAQFLTSQRYTRSSLLGVVGEGAGALLAAASVVQRPELFGAAVLDGGLYDMTRFDRFTVGPSWTPEFGSPDRPADLHALLTYSPLQMLRAGAHYPPTLISDGEHDDVSTPAQSLKFAAALEVINGASAPTLLRLDFDTGFGPDTSLEKQIALDADWLTFLIDTLHGTR